MASGQRGEGVDAFRAQSSLARQDPGALGIWATVCAVQTDGGPCVYVCASVHACVRAWVRACMLACVLACVLAPRCVRATVMVTSKLHVQT